ASVAVVVGAASAAVVVGADPAAVVVGADPAAVEAVAAGAAVGSNPEPALLADAGSLPSPSAPKSILICPSSSFTTPGLTETVSGKSRPTLAVGLLVLDRLE